MKPVINQSQNSKLIITTQHNRKHRFASTNHDVGPDSLLRLWWSHLPERGQSVRELFSARCGLVDVVATGSGRR
jgi:hypothetical protein